MTRRKPQPRKRGALEEVRRDMYLGQRGIGDYQAYRRGRLPARITRRGVTRRVMRGIFRGR